MADKALENFIENVCGDSHLRVEADLGDGFVRLRSAEAERRQAVHDIRSTEDVVIELLRNARAMPMLGAFSWRRRERNDGGASSWWTMVTVYRLLCMSGYSSRALRPKLDTMHMDKWGVHGRGHGAVLYRRERRNSSDRRIGCRQGLCIRGGDRSRSDRGEDRSVYVSHLRAHGIRQVWPCAAPKNILRTACEFALESRRSCTVYLGSATDITATLYEFGLSSLTSAMRAFCADTTRLPVCTRLAAAP